MLMKYICTILKSTIQYSTNSNFLENYSKRVLHILVVPKY